jgi:hypothetical protein
VSATGGAPGAEEPSERRDVRLARTALGVSAAAFAGPGLGFALWPAGTAAWVDLAILGPTGASDVRAVMGGLELAIAGLLAACALTRRHLAPGLVLQIAAASGLLAGRALGLAGDGSPGALGWALAAAELVQLALGLAAAGALGLAWRGTRRIAGAP